MSGLIDGGREQYDDLMDGANPDVDVDTSWLDTFRAGGPEALEKKRQEEAEAARERAEAAGQADSFYRGGSQSSTGQEAEAVQHVEPDQPVTDETLDAYEPASPVPSEGELDEAEAFTLSKTDHQEDAQNQAAGRGGSGTGQSGSATGLPRTRFAVSGQRGQPTVKMLPGQLVSGLREQVRLAAVRDRGVSDRAARDFAGRLSQASLVVAFLGAQLDTTVEVDASTAAAIELFRGADPLLGAVAQRMASLEQQVADNRTVLDRSDQRLRESARTQGVLEQGLAYLLADRLSNISRGTRDVSDLELTQRDAVTARDLAREQTDKHRRFERDREGRPIR